MDQANNAAVRRLIPPTPWSRSLALLSQLYFTALLSSKRYDKRYEDRFLPQVERTPEIQSLRS
jgi:hypothetical protein